MHQGTMEPEDDLSTRDPLDLLSDLGVVPSTSSSLLNSTLLVQGGLSHSGILERDDSSGDPESPKGLFPTLEPCGNEQRSLRSSSFPSSLTWDSDSEKETLDEEELQHFSNPHGLAAHSPGSPTSGQQQSRLDIDLCQEPVEHLFDAKIIPSALEDDDVTHRNPTTADSQKLTEKIEQDKGSHLPDVIPKNRCQKVKEDSLRKHNQKGLVKASTKEPDVYTFPGDSEPESPPPGPWAHCTFIQRRRKKRAILRPFSGLGNWHRTTGAGRRARVKPSGAKELTKSTDVEGGMLGLNRGKEKKVQKRQKSVVSHLGGQEIFTCVECSIYFKKRDHLREHMREHGQGEPGKKLQCGEKESWSGHPTKSGFECVECGLEFADQVPLLDHQRCHEESRQKILEEIGKLNERETRAAEQASCSKASDPITEALPEVGSGQLVCLKCSFSCDVPQELADHAKTHNTRTRVDVYRTSPRFQQRSCKKEQGQSSGGDATTLVSLFGKRYPIRASKKTKTQPGPSQAPLNPSTQGEPSPDKGTTHPETVGESQEESQTEMPAVDEPVEENVHPPFMSSPQNPRKNVAPRCRDVAFKSIVNKCSARAARGRLGRTRASTRLDPKSNQTQQVQILNETEENQIPEPDHDPKQGSKTDPVEVPAPALQLKSGFTASLRGAAERLGLLQGSQAQLRNKLPLVLIESDSSDHQTPLSYNMVMGRKPPANAVDLQAGLSSTQSSKKLDPPEDELKHKEQSYSGGKCEEDVLVATKLEGDDDDDDDVVNRLFGVLTEEDDEDDDGEGLSKNVERKCPYCPDRFHNGIGLANHIRGHLNRVGVSYNVRHFISPEEVNAIEKKFSYQKKKKKVANFDPSTFSVMRCEFCSAGFDTRAGLSSHARAHLRDFGITNWEVTASPINILRELFAKHPNLVLPTPSHTLQSSQDENSDDEHDEKHEENVTTESIAESPKQHWKEKHNMKEAEEGGEEVEDDNDEEEDAKKKLTDKSATSPREKTLFSFQEQSPESKETDTIASSLLKCEFCGATFETRRGLSSHARSHLRQLGIGMAENSGAPIDLLRQIAKERATDARFTGTPPSMASPKKPQHHTLTIPSPTKDIETEEDNKPTVSFCARPSVKVSSPPAASSAAGSLPSSPFVKSRSPSPVLRKAPISSLLPASSPLRSQEHKTLGKNKATNLSSPNKPFWAPQDTDAPLNLTMEMDSKDIICQLCGAWFETRKGLSSHARAHLRHFGIEYSESKGSPIDLLNRFILTDDFKHKANSFLSDAPGDLRSQKTSAASTLPSTSSAKMPLASSLILFKTTPMKTNIGPKATSPSAHLLGPPAKKLKSSSIQVLRFGGGDALPFPIEPTKDVSCEFCGELFENRKGLSSHARSHLRQLGITEWSVNGSPIDTLREIIVRRGLPSITPLKSPKSPSSPLARHALHSSSPSGNNLGRLPYHFPQSPSQDQPTIRKMSPSISTTSSSPAVEMVKPKPEPELVEVTMKGSDEGYSPEQQHSGSNSSDVYPINFVMTQEKEPSRDIRCEFCGEFFENRKGLSSHARSHLRHMGITEWSVNGSPIDTLWEVMRRQGTTPASVILGIKEEPGQDGGVSLNYHSPALSRKSPLNLLHSGSRLHKHGLGSVSLSPTLPVTKLFAMTPLKKKMLGEEGVSGEKSLPIQSKNFSPPPQDYSFKSKVSAEKHGMVHMDASCELCGFYFENRKALASHARAHLRQFGVTEWCVNGSPIETLSAWIRSRPQKAAEMQQSYAQGARYTQKKRCNSTLLPSRDSDRTTHSSHKPSVSKWASLTLPQKRAMGRDANSSSWGLSIRAPEPKSRSASSSQHSLIPQSDSRHSNNTLPHAQVAHSELNVRVPRGFERRPPKHPSHTDGGERESGPPKPRSSTVHSLVPKPPSTPLVRLVGKIYSLKCRFCDVEFHGPLSVQEDWIRHLQQHILNLNYNKTDPPVNDPSAPEPPAATSTSTTTFTATPSMPPPDPTATPTPASILTPSPTHASSAPLVASAAPQTTAEPLSSPNY